MNQCEMIVEYMKENGSITSLEAIQNLGCTRLSARISDLKDAGYRIHSEMVKVKTRNGKTKVMRYSLES